MSKNSCKNLTFIVYFEVLIEKRRSYKSFISSHSKTEAKEIFFKKINRELKGFLVSNVKVFRLNKESYKGKIIPDKHWESIQNFCYPNGRHRLRKFHSKSWFRPLCYPNRNNLGKFIKGNSPWNKGLKIKCVKRKNDGKFCQSRNSLGQFKKGVKPIVVGCNIKDE